MHMQNKVSKAELINKWEALLADVLPIDWADVTMESVSKHIKKVTNITIPNPDFKLIDEIELNQSKDEK